MNPRRPVIVLSNARYPRYRAHPRARTSGHHDPPVELARRVAGLFGGFGEGWRIIALLGHELTPELVERSLVALTHHRARTASTLMAQGFGKS